MCEDGGGRDTEIGEAGVRAGCGGVAGEFGFGEDGVGVGRVGGDDGAGDEENDDGLGWVGVAVLRSGDFGCLSTYDALEVCATAVPPSTIGCPELVEMVSVMKRMCAE